jgi:hypothetical protein
VNRLLLLALLAAACNTFNPDMSMGPTEELGAWYVAQRGCAACHKSGNTLFGTLSGNERELGGSFGGGVAYGSNLTPDTFSGIGTWTDADIATALRNGRDPQGNLLCLPMPRYPDMSDLEVASIILHLRSVPPVYHPIPASTCPGQPP